MKLIDDLKNKYAFIVFKFHYVQMEQEIKEKRMNEIIGV